MRRKTLQNVCKRNKVAVLQRLCLVYGGGKRCVLVTFEA